MVKKQPSGGSASVIERGGSIFSTIMLLAWPILLEQLLMTMVQYADTAMVGVLGANATAAVAINSSSINMVNGLCMAIGVGFTALVARSIGANNIDRAKALTGQALLVVVALGAFFTTVMVSLSRYIPVWMGGEPEILDDARAYLFVIASVMLFRALSTILSAILRGAGDTRTPLVANIIANVLNLMGNYLLIYETRTITVFGGSFRMWGAGLGVVGAAIPTAMSIVVAGLIVLYVVFTRESPIKLERGVSLRPDPTLLKSAFRISLPTMGERLAMSIGQTAVTFIVTSLGTVSLAAHHLAITAEALCFMPAFAFASSATTLVGQSLGAKREDLADKLSMGVIKISTGALAVAGCVLYVAATPLIRIFTKDPLVIPLAAECLRIVAFSQPLTGISMSITGVLRGAGDTKWPLLVVLISMWSLRITLAYILCIKLSYGLQGMWFCMVMDFGMRSLLLGLRYRSGRWKHVLKDHDEGTGLVAECAE
jgi:putative MATE family efflux protein